MSDVKPQKPKFRSLAVVALVVSTALAGLLGGYAIADSLQGNRDALAQNAASLGQLGDIAALSPLTESVWRRFFDFTAALADVDPDDSELRWSIEAMSDDELTALLADCELILTAEDVRADVRQLAALGATVAETMLAGAVDEVYLLAACLTASEVQSENDRRDAA